MRRRGHCSSFSNMWKADLWLASCMDVGRYLHTREDQCQTLPNEWATVTTEALRLSVIILHCSNDLFCSPLQLDEDIVRRLYTSHLLQGLVYLHGQG